MSADNGTYILQTYGPEYRVVHAQAIDNIYDEYDQKTHTWSPDKSAMVEYFGESEVYSSLEEALDVANVIDEASGYSEYGVVLISEFATHKFEDFNKED